RKTSTTSRRNPDANDFHFQAALIKLERLAIARRQTLHLNRKSRPGGIARRIKTKIFGQSGSDDYFPLRLATKKAAGHQGILDERQLSGLRGQSGRRNFFQFVPMPNLNP